jgi:hypothetical protein
VLDTRASGDLSTSFRWNDYRNRQVQVASLNTGRRRMSPEAEPDESNQGTALARRWRALDRGWQATLLGLGGGSALFDVLARPPV